MRDLDPKLNHFKGAVISGVKKESRDYVNRMFKEKLDIPGLIGEGC